MSRKRETVTRISLSLPPTLLAKFEAAAFEAGFADRSKAIQSTLRDFVADKVETLRDEDTILGSLLVLYDHEARGVDAALTDLEHHSMRIITSSIHVHLDSRRCLKVVILKGRFAEIRTLQRSLRNLRGVLQLKLSLLRPDVD